MRRAGAAAGILLAGLLLWGCGKSGAGEGDTGNNIAAEEISVSVIEVQKDGSIIETITEDFTKEYYDEEGLRNMVLSEVADFNNGAQEAISVDKFENKNGRIVVVMQYPSAEAYTEYNTNAYDNKKLFFGTVAQAYDAGYSMDITLQNVKKEEETVGKEEILAMGDKHILIACEPVQVATFGRILYAGENISVSGKNKAVMQAGEEGESLGEYYLIF